MHVLVTYPNRVSGISRVCSGKSDCLVAGSWAPHLFGLARAWDDVVGGHLAELGRTRLVVGAEHRRLDHAGRHDLTPAKGARQGLQP
eukprot:6205893-Pleurochrysis_carterae.AAC.2